jgi:hypothetical protein
MDAKLQNWCDKAEELKVKLGDEYWKMNIGVPYSKDAIASLEKENGAHAVDFLKAFKEPFSLLLDATDSVASSKTYDLYMELHELRKTKVASKTEKFNGKPVTWSTWRQFVSTASDKQRKVVFDEFVKLAPVITPTITKRFKLIVDVYKEHGLDPLDSYCNDHRMSLKTLKSTMTHLRDGVRHEFERQWKHYMQEHLERDPQYHDDFYFMRNAIFSNLKNAPIDPIKSIFTTAKELGFDPTKILLDKEDRPDKYASPFCSFVRIPTDVRISYKPENPINDLSSVFHEYGHGLHAISIKKDLPYWTKYVTSNGLNETFSTLFEDLIHDPVFLEHKLGIKPDIAEDLVARIRFSRLYAIAFYSANSLFRIETWEKKVPFEKWDALYAKHYKECMGVEMPGQYWQLHHILPESTMYVPSYLLAEINAFNIANEAKDDFGKHWWEEKAAGIYIKGVMQDGADSEAGTFEKIDPKAFIKEITKNSA